MFKGWVRLTLNNRFLFGSIYVISLFAVFGMCCYFVVRAHEDTLSHLPEKTMAAYIEEQRIIAKGLKELEKASVDAKEPRDSILEIVRCSQLMLLRQQETLVDDFRQEMNNNINKMNTWLAFAVGMLSVLGVFVPLALQYRMQSQDEKNFKALSDKQDERFKSLSDKLKLELENQKKEYKTLSEDSRKEMELAQLASHYNALYIGYEVGALVQYGNREELFRMIWKEALKSFVDVVNTCFNQEFETREGYLRTKVLMVEGLIKLQGMLTMMRNHRGSIRQRTVWTIGEDIHTLIDKINSATETKESYRLIHESLKELINKLDDLNRQLPLSR